ncbi:replication endonuclease [Shewanella sp. H8]|uniref:replication endonuclease n=1 Tax=Shewanella sp. H8 TaxID=3342676 RepID=UPI003315255F
MFILPSSLEPYFSHNLFKVKFLGVNISQSAAKVVRDNDLSLDSKRDNDYDFRSIFSHHTHYGIFCYNFDKITKLRKKITSKVEALNELSIRAKKTRLKILERIERLNSNLDKALFESKQRFLNADYCKRKMVRLFLSEMLYVAQKNKEVGGKKGESAYASRLMVSFRKMQNEYNKEFLDSKKILVNGEYKSLLEFVDTANTNAAKLYARIKGLQNLAEMRTEDLKSKNSASLGFGWAFLTMTAPPEYHSNPTTTKQRKSWNRKNAIESKKYLTECWKALGRDWERFNISVKNGDVFGCRVSEANKDGTLHGHIVIFYDRSKEDKLFSNQGIFYKHFARVSKHQLKIVIGDVDSEKGESSKVSSASSYCFKYINKAVGVDVIDLDKDKSELDKESEKDMLIKIDAWRAAIGARAFNFFGIKGYSAVWDALRKISHRTGLTTKKQFKKHGKLSTNVVYEDPKPCTITAQEFENELSLLTERLTDEEQGAKLDYYLLNKYSSQHIEYSGGNYSQGDLLELDEKTLKEISTHFMEPEDTFSSDSGDGDFHFDSEYELRRKKELDWYIKLNGTFNDYQICEKEYCFRKVLEHSVNGDFAKFQRACEKYNVELIGEKELNKYGETVKKIIGVNTGTWVYLFKKYVIIDTQVESKKV